MRRTIIFALIALASFMAPIANAQWAEAYYNSGAFNGFHFTDSLNGWFTHLGADKIIHTSDGGYTFQVQQVIVGPYGLYDIYMEDNLNGWACGSNTGYGPGYIYRTTNGGADWIQQTHPASESGWTDIVKVGQSIWFLGVTGISSNNHTLLMKTSDGGNSWDLTEYPQFLEAFEFVVFDSLNFIIYGENSILSRTTDGGNSWISANLPSDYQVEKVRFLDNNLGYALVTDLSHFPRDVYLYKSTDGGFVWNIHYSWLSSAQKRGLSIIPETGTIFVAGYLDQSGAKGILKSNDGGISWNTFSTNYLVTGLYTSSRYCGW